MGSSLKITFDHFFTISVFWLLLLRFFLFLRNFHILSYFFSFYTKSFYTKHENSHWVLTEESPRLTTMDDYNTLAVFAGYYTRCHQVAGIHPGLIKLNEIKTPVLEFFDMHRTRFAVLQYYCLFTRAFLPSQAYFQQ